MQCTIHTILQYIYPIPLPWVFALLGGGRLVQGEQLEIMGTLARNAQPLQKFQEFQVSFYTLQHYPKMNILQKPLLLN